MAGAVRARSIKPGFFANEDLIELPFEYRLLFVGLWTMADREGRLEDRPKKIKLQIFPGDDVDCEAGLEALYEHGFILRYTVAGTGYIQVKNWSKHQHPHVKEAASTFPAPDEPGASPVRAPTKVSADTSVARLTPSSLTPDSPFLDSGSLRSPSVPQERDDGPVERVFEHWQTEFQHPRASLDPKRRKLIVAALRSYDEPTLRQAISGYRYSPHHMGENSNRTVYDDIELILRDAKHIEAGINFARAPPTPAKNAVELARERLRASTGNGNGRVVSEQSGSGSGESGVGALARMFR